jgi:hypothetical protein
MHLSAAAGYDEEDEGLATAEERTAAAIAAGAPPLDAATQVVAHLTTAVSPALFLNEIHSSNGVGVGTARGGGGDDESLLLNMLRGRGSGGGPTSSSIPSTWEMLTGGSQIGMGAPGSVPYLPLSTGGGNRPPSLFEQQHSEPPGEAFLLARALLQEVAATGSTPGAANSSINWPTALSHTGGGQTILHHQRGLATSSMLPSSYSAQHHHQVASSTSFPPTQPKSSTTPSSIIVGTGKKPKLMHTRSDDESLSPYQCLVRRQIEIFEATEADIHTTAQGRNRPIVLGQVGIRCVHCGRLPVEKRARGAVYFPSTLLSTYQTAQNMANTHLIKDCFEISKAIREDLVRIRLRENSESKNTRKSAFGGGRGYWASGLRAQGVVETEDRRLRFDNAT